MNSWGSKEEWFYFYYKCYRSEYCYLLSLCHSYFQAAKNTTQQNWTDISRFNTQYSSMIIFINISRTLVHILFTFTMSSKLGCDDFLFSKVTVLVLNIRQCGFFQVNFWWRILEVNSACWTGNNYFPQN